MFIFVDDEAKIKCIGIILIAAGLGGCGKL